MTNVGTLYNVHHIGKCRGTKWQVELGLLEGSQTSVVDLDPDPVGSGLFGSPGAGSGLFGSLASGSGKIPDPDPLALKGPCNYNFLVI